MVRTSRWLARGVSLRAGSSLLGIQTLAEVYLDRNPTIPPDSTRLDTPNRRALITLTGLSAYPGEHAPVVLGGNGQGPGDTVYQTHACHDRFIRVIQVLQEEETRKLAVHLVN